MKLDWIKETEWEDILTGDMREMADLVGIENFIKLLERYGKMQVHFSTKDVSRLKQNYIQKYFESGNAKMLARKLETSERFVHLAVQSEKTDNQIDIFDKEEAL